MRCTLILNNKYKGMKFNKVTIIGDVGIRTSGQKIKYLCRCDCGAEFYTTIDKLKSGHTKSCGCSRRKGSDLVKNHKHFMRAKGILKRCNDPKYHNYRNYGGRGIKCELGTTVSEITESLDKVPGYFEGAQIDRIDNDGNYTLHHPIHGTNPWVYHDDTLNKDFQALGNLRWVSIAENALNKSSTLTLVDLAETPRYPKDVQTIINRRGWKMDDFYIKLVYDEKVERYLWRTIHKTLLNKYIENN